MSAATEGRLAVAVAMLTECLGPLEVSAATIESEDGGESIETLIDQVRKFCADALAGQQAEPTTFRKWWTEKGQFTRPNLSTEPADFAFERAVAHAAWKAALAGQQANPPKEPEPHVMQEMIDRFLSWPLPKDFTPDCGINFDGRGRDARGYEKQWPVGTNLLTAEQARAMLEHVLAGRQASHQDEGEPAQQDTKDCTLCNGLGFYGSPGARCEWCKGTGKAPQAPTVRSNGNGRAYAARDEGRCIVSSSQTDTAFLCRIWGEDIDHTLTAIVHDWEGVRRFCVEFYIGSEDHMSYSGENTLDLLKTEFDDHEEDQRGGAYVENWEIGGISIERICDCTPVAAQQAPTGQQAGTVDRQGLIDWVAERWHAEVANRPMVNVHRRSLDDTWRQMLRHLGVDARSRLGPTHDELRAEIGSKEWEALTGQQAEPKALRDVAAERERQKTVEGWTPKHDDLEHDDGALAIAAACYAIADRTALDTRTVRVTSLWEWTGWEPSGFKPRDRRSNLVRSGALILAEIERIDRAALAADKKGESNGNG